MKSKIIEVNGVNVHYFDAGSVNNPAIILIHGFHNSAASMEVLIKPISKYFHVIVPDLPGFGKSDKLNRRFSIKACGQMLIDFIQKLKLSGYYLTGFSMGAGVVLESLLINYKDCRGVILIYPLAFGKYIKINRKKRMAINTLVLLTKFPVTKHVTKKVFYSDRLMFQVFKRLSDSKNTTDEDIRRRISNSRLCRFSTYAQGVSSVLKYKPSIHKKFPRLKAFLILNDNDELIDPKITTRVYRSFFPKLKLFSLNFDKHLPSKHEIEEKFDLEFPYLLEQMKKEFGMIQE